MSKINKVLYNVDQRDSSLGTVNTREEMWMARNNIGLDDVIGHATVTENDKEYKGIAPLGTNGLVPVEFLPSFVNVVVNGYYCNGKFYQDAEHVTEISPDENTTFVDITVADVGVGYRWTQTSGYFQISNQNAFGALTDGTNSIHADQPMDLLTITGQGGVTVSVSDSSHSDTLTIGHSNSVTSGYIGENSSSTTISNTFNLPWAHYDDHGHITESGSNAITIQSATTTNVGVTQLVSTAGTGEDKAVTQKGVQAAIDQLNETKSDTGTNVTVTVVEEKGKLKSVTVSDDTAKGVHSHGNITSDGKVTTAAATKKSLVITNSSDQVVVGPAFGVEDGDDNLFLNKNGNWITTNTKGASAYVDSYGNYGLVTLYVTSGTNVGTWSTFASGLKSTYVGNGINMMQVDVAGGLYVDVEPSSSNFGKVCVNSGGGLYLNSNDELGIKVNNGLYIDQSDTSKGIGLIMSSDFYSGSSSNRPVAWNFEAQCFWFNKPNLYVSTTPTAYVQTNTNTTNSDTYLQFNPGCYTGDPNTNELGERSFVKFTGANGISVSSVADTTNKTLSTITFDLGEASSTTLGGIKIGYTQSDTNYPVELADGKAYVTVPLPELANDNADGLLSSTLYTKLNTSDSVYIITSGGGGSLTTDELSKLNAAASNKLALTIFTEYNSIPATFLRGDSGGYHFATPVTSTGTYYTYDISLAGNVVKTTRSIGGFKYDTNRRAATWSSGVATITLPTNNCYYFDCYMELPDDSGDHDCGLTIDLGTLLDGEAPNIECDLRVRNMVSTVDAGSSVRVSVKYCLNGESSVRYATHMNQLGTGGYITIPNVNTDAIYSISIRGGHLFIAN